MGAPTITLSIVSHGQNALVNPLLEALAATRRIRKAVRAVLPKGLLRGSGGKRGRPKP